MAASSSVAVRNVMLQAIKDWNPDVNGVNIYIGAYTTDSDGAVLAEVEVTYSTPASSAMDISNVVLNIGAGESVGHLRIQKETQVNATTIYKKDITAEAFTYAGTITITSAEISIADAA